MAKFFIIFRSVISFSDYMNIFRNRSHDLAILPFPDKNVVTLAVLTIGLTLRMDAFSLPMKKNQ